ncbi:MAG: hypothetical protein ACRDGQ_02620 [Candidatus Limnocylindrales bacterium]
MNEPPAHGPRRSQPANQPTGGSGRRGIVEIVDRLESPIGASPACYACELLPRFEGRWRRGPGRDAPFEDGPGWEKVAAALAWARARADVVIVRIGAHGARFSAGTSEPPGPGLPRWPDTP